MYTHFINGTNYAQRKVFQRIRFFILLLFPVAFSLAPIRFRVYLSSLLILWLVVLGIDFSRAKKLLINHNLTGHDWIIIAGTNLCFTGLVSLTNGINSPLGVLLILPTLFFTIEYNILTGIGNLTYLLLLLGWWLLSPSRFSVTHLFTAFGWLFLTGLILAIIIVRNSIITRYYHKIMPLIIYDDLTGLYNRRYLKTLVRGAIKDQKPFILIMLDINFFKYYNDKWGHSGGDSLLKKFGRFLQQMVSENDTVIRIAGDEFVLFMPQTTTKEINPAVEKIQNSILECHFNGEECFPRKKLTISIGAVSFPEDATSYETLLEKVDRNLYQFKKIYS